jgi:hypothetical protein
MFVLAKKSRISVMPEEPGQVSRVAEEAQLCSSWPKSRVSV